EQNGSRSASGESAASSVDGGEAPAPKIVSSSRGVLTIQATPPDAQVAVDGVSVDGPSPFVHTLDAGKHKVSVKHPSYLDYEKEVEVTDAGLSLPVKLAPKQVTLIVETDPVGGNVSLVVDDQVVSTVASGGKIPLTRDPTKKYEVQAALAGHVTQRNSLDFTGEASQAVKVTMSKDGTVVATGVPPTPTPTADPAPRPRDPGTRPKKPSGGGGSRKPAGGGGGSRKPKAAAKTATLKIGTNMGVAPAKVYVDGKFVGNTPQGNVKVTPGRHTVKWVWPNGKTKSQSVVVPDNGSKIVKAG
ncbi:MAG: PEGA domain-containing protein, partial [Myxococcota bacterium]